MHSTISPRPVEAVVAAALHRVFATAPHAPDSLELWLEVAAEAVTQLRHPVAAPPSMPVFLIYRKQRTEARLHLDTATVHITSGPLTGTIHADLEGAATSPSPTHCRRGGSPTTRTRRPSHRPPSTDAPAHHNAPGWGHADHCVALSGGRFTTGPGPMAWPRNLAPRKGIRAVRTIGYFRDCRKFKTVAITSQNLIVNRLEGICDDCASTARPRPETWTPRPRAPRNT